MSEQPFPYEVFSFYKFTPVQDPATFQEEHLAFCKSIGVQSRIIVATEGINGVVSGTREACRQYREHLSGFPEFSDIHFKIDETEKPYMRGTYVRHKKEIINSGIDAIEHITPLKRTGDHIDPKEFKQLKDRDDVVVVDVRSKYETEVGHFKNAVTLDIDNFREFPEKLQALEAYKDKKILTYCTGGIKCEKATSLLLEKGFEDVGQLEGGILNYAKKEGGEDFRGKCYVFDERVVINVNQVNPEVISTCIHCGRESARMINCANAACNQQLVMCEDCGWEWSGACSHECLHHPKKRPYDGTGYYPKDRVRNNQSESSKANTAQ